MSKATKHFLKQISVWTINVLFILWILPLGVFIKPDQEEKACNGRRAICLCSHLLGKVLDKVSGKTLLRQSGASPQKENASSSPDYLVSNLREQRRPSALRTHIETNTIAYSFLFTRAIDPVPKNPFFLV